LEGIQNLKKIKVLICKENRLENCSDLNNKELEILDLQKNQLSNSEEIKNVILKLQNLKKLDLRDNCFIEESQLMTSIIRDSPQLESYNMDKIDSFQYSNDNESNNYKIKFIIFCLLLL
jgi:Ran GTPase-activating protein (RanGAP) involved in mRNA processing and transport